MRKLSSLLFTTLIGVVIIALKHESMAQTSAAPAAARVVSTNDNTRPAGRLEADLLNVRLYAGVGMTALIEREGDGCVSLCPGLDIASQGDTVETARDNLREALELFLNRRCQKK